MRIRLAIPDELDDQDRKLALNAALESVTRVNEALIRKGSVPTAAELIAQGARWQPEPPGDEHFDIGTTVANRGHGDCDDWAPLHAASLRASGTDPGARAVVSRSGPKRWHAWVLRSDGSKEDPSRAAGMGDSVSGDGGEVGAGPAIHSPMSAEGRLCIALCPSRDPRHPLVWFARCDAPDHCEPWSWSSTSVHPSPKSALLHSIKTVRGVCGEEIDDEDSMRLGALHDLVLGCSPEEIAEELDGIFAGDEDADVDGIVEDALHSVGFLGDIVRSVSKPFRKLTKPFSGIANAALPFFAGFGGPHSAVLSALAKSDPLAFTAAMRGAHAPGGGGDQTPAFLRAREFFARHPLGPTTLPFAQMALPAIFPGAGSLFMGLANPAGGGPGLEQLLAQMQATPGAAPPTFKAEPGAVVQPWGGFGPSVMTF